MPENLQDFLLPAGKGDFRLDRPEDVSSALKYLNSKEVEVGNVTFNVDNIVSMIEYDWMKDKQENPDKYYTEIATNYKDGIVRMRPKGQEAQAGGGWFSNSANKFLEAIGSMGVDLGVSALRIGAMGSPTSLMIPKHPLEYDMMDMQLANMSKGGKDWLAEKLPTYKGYEDSFWFGDVPAAFGSMSAFMVSGLLGKAVGVGAKAMPMLLGAMTQSEAMAADATLSTDPKKNPNASRIAWLAGIGLGMTEGLPIDHMLKRAGGLAFTAKNKVVYKEADKILNSLRDFLKGDKAKLFTKANMKDLTKESTLQGLEEFLQEGTQTLGENITAQQLYDTQRELMDGTFRGGAAGFVSGFMMTLIGRTAAIRRRNAQHNIARAKMSPEEAKTLETIVDVAEKHNKEQIETAANQSASADLFAMAEALGKSNTTEIIAEDMDIPNSEAAVAAGQATVSEDLKDNIEETAKNMADPNYNVIDQTIALGYKNMVSFLNGFNRSTEQTKLEVEELDHDRINKLSPKDLNQFTEEAYGALVSFGLTENEAEGTPSINDLLDLPDNISDDLRSDILVGHMLGYGDTGWQLIRQKHLNKPSEMSPKAINELITKMEGRLNPAHVKQGMAIFNQALFKNLENMGQLERNQTAQDQIKEEAPSKNAITKAEDVVEQVQMEKPTDTGMTFTATIDGTEVEGITNPMDLPGAEGMSLEGIDLSTLAEGPITPTEEVTSSEPQPTISSAYNKARESLGWTQEKWDEVQATTTKEMITNPELANEEQRQLLDAKADAIATHAAERLGTIAEKQTPSAQATEEIDLSDEFWQEGESPLGAAQYGQLLSEFEGDTINELFDYLDKKEIKSESLQYLIDTIKPIVGDVTVLSGPFIEKHRLDRGMYSPSKNTIYINSSIAVDSKEELLKTLVHESIHAMVVPFVRSGDKNAAKFYSAVSQLMNTVRSTIEKPGYMTKAGEVRRIGITNEQLNKFLNKHGGELQKALKNPDEFIAHMLGETNVLRNLASQIYAGEQPTQKKKNVLYRFVEALWNTMKDWLNIKAQPVEGNIIEALVAHLQAYEPQMVAFHAARTESEQASRTIMEQKNLDQMPIDVDRPLMSDSEIEKLEDDLDYGQEDPTDSQEIADLGVMTSFVDTLALLSGTSTPKYMQRIRKMTESEFFNEVKRLDQSTGLISGEGLLTQKIRNLYEKVYKKKTSTLEKFERRLLVKTIVRAKSISPKNFLSIRMTRGGGKMQGGSQFSVSHLGTHFTTPGGTRGSSIREDITLEKFIKPLEGILDLPDGTLGVSFVNDFSLYDSDGNLERSVNINKLNKSMLGQRFSEATVSEILADKLARTVDANGNKHVYLGNFGGKNTMVLLTVNNKQYSQFMNALNGFYMQYKPIVEQAHGIQLPPTLSNNNRDVTNTARLLLEDMWYGAKIVDGKIQTVIASKDVNKIFKRGGKWTYAKTVVVRDPKLLQLIIGDRQLSGIRLDGNVAKARSVIFDSTDEGTITIGDKEYNIQDMLKNYITYSDERAETTDGATFFLLGEMDELYYDMNGSLKEGTIKNLLASQAGDQKPLFIKHAMHGISRNSPLGRFMIENDLALLISDTSAKEGAPSYDVTDTSYGKIKLSESLNGLPIVQGQYESRKIFEIPIERFARIKEELNIDTNRGAMKQLNNGTGVTKGNPAMKEGDPNNDIINTIADHILRSVANTNEYYTGLDNKAFLDMMKEIAENPTSYKDQAVADMLRNMLVGSDEDILARFGQNLHLPAIAEILRNKMQKTLNNTLESKTYGGRAALEPNIGYLNEDSNVKPVENAVKHVLLNNDINDPWFKAAVPDETTRKKITTITNLQRMISIAKQNKGVYASKAGREHTVADLTAKLKLVKDSLSVLKNGGTIYDLIDLEAPHVPTYIKAVKNRMLDEASGRLKRGHAIISQDLASMFGIKAGDRVLMVVTPTDSLTGVIPVTIAGIAPSYGANKVIGSNKVIMDSEYIQTVVGKDFDIDTISIIPFNEKSWDAQGYEKMLDALEKVNKAYDKQILKSYRSVFSKDGNSFPRNAAGQEIPINLKAIADPNVRTHYCKMLMGEDKTAMKVYPALGEGASNIHDKYVVDKSAIIVERLWHTALSAINFKVNDMELPPGRSVSKATFNINNKDWFNTHLLHLIWTNNSVDAPSNTDIFEYNSDLSDQGTRTRAFQYMWGLDNRTVGKGGLGFNEIEAVRETLQMIFGRSFSLASILNPDDRSRLDMREFSKLLTEQQYLFWMFNNDRQGLIDIMRQRYRKELKTKLERAKNDTAKNKLKVYYTEKLEFVTRFLTKAEIGNLNEYPLFSLINNLNVAAYPIPGLTHGDNLIVESSASLNLAKTFPVLQELLQKGILAEAAPGGYKFEYFTKKETQQIKGGIVQAGQIYDPFINPISPENLSALVEEDPDLAAKVVYDDNGNAAIRLATDVRSIGLSLLTKELGFQEGSNLDDVKRTTIALLQAQDEIAAKTETSGVKLNRAARTKVYPQLFEMLMENPSLVFEPDMNGVEMVTEDGPIRFYRGTNGDIIFNMTEKDQSFSVSSRELDNNSEIAGIVKKHFFIGGNGWANPKNRLKLNSLLSLQKNIPVEKRIEAVKKYIWDNLYTEDRTRDETAAFWISSMGQLTNAATKDGRGMNFIVNKSLYSEERPLQFQANTLLLELMAEFEPVLLNMYLELTNNAISNMAMKSIPNDLARAREMFMKDSTEYFSEEGRDYNNPYSMAQQMYDKYSAELTSTSFKYLELAKFIRLGKKEGYGAAFKELKKLAKDLASRMAFAENGIHAAQWQKDIKELSASQFAAKYDKLSDTVLGTSVSMAHLKAEEKLAPLDPTSGELQNKSLKSLVAMYNLILAMRVPYIKGEKVPTRTNKYLASTASYVNLGRRKEIKPFVFLNQDEVLDFALNTSKYGIKNVTFGDLTKTFKAKATRSETGVGFSTIAVHKQRALDRALKTYTGKMHRYVDNLEEIINVLISPADRHKFVVKNERLLNEDPGKLSESQRARQKFLQLVQKVADENSYTREYIAERVFDTAENMKKKYGITVSLSLEYVDGKKTQIPRYYYQDKSYTSIMDMLDIAFNKMPDFDKMILTGALNIRQMFDTDVHVILESVRQYLASAFNRFEGIAQLDNSAWDSAALVNQYAKRYVKYIETALKDKGNYMPHQFAFSIYKGMFKKEHMKEIEHSIRLNIEIEQAKAFKGQPHNAVMANLTEEEIAERVNEATEKKWRETEENQLGTPVISNFMQRGRGLDAKTGYLKASTMIYTDYISKFINGIKEDIMYIDWNLYRTQAARAGEKASTMEMTRMWYADQTSNHLLHSVPMKLEEAKPGMEINFSVEGEQAMPTSAQNLTSRVIINGIYKGKGKDADGEYIQMHIDSAKVRAALRERLVVAQKLHNNLIKNVYNPKPTNRQRAQVTQLVKQGYLTKQEVENAVEQAQSMAPGYFSQKDISKLIVTGTERAVNDPGRMGKFYTKNIIITESNGKEVKGTKVNRYLRRGAHEYIQGRIREAENMRIIGMDNPSTFDSMMYDKFKFVGLVPGYVLDTLKIGVNLAIMGGPTGVPAAVQNYLGIMKGNMIESPRDNLRLLKEWKAIYNRVTTTNYQELTEGEQDIHDRLLSLGLIEREDFIDISLAAGNMSIKDAYVNKDWGEVVDLFMGAFKDAAPYQRSRERIQELNDQKLIADVKGDIKAKIKLEHEIALEELKWNGIVNKYISEEKSYTPEEMNKILNEVKAKLEAGELTATNLAEKTGLDNPALILNLAMTTLSKKAFVSPVFGIGLQAKAERLRSDTYGIAYLKAKEKGFGSEDADIFAMNQVERINAYYDEANKQFAANTKYGKFLQTFTQFVYNAYEQYAKEAKEGFAQWLEHAPLEGEGFTGSSGGIGKKFTGKTGILGHIGFALAKDIEIAPGKYEDNVARATLLRTMITAMNAQFGATVLYGWANSDDPLGETIYDFFRALFTLFSDERMTRKERERFEQSLIFLGQNMLFWRAGLPIKTLISFLTNMDEFGERTGRGRPGLPIQTAERLYNTARKAAGEDLGWDEGTVFSPYYVDKMLGLYLLTPLKDERGRKRSILDRMEDNLTTFAIPYSDFILK